jgi:hypothetical protein
VVVAAGVVRPPPPPLLADRRLRQDEPEECRSNEQPRDDRQGGGKRALLELGEEGRSDGGDAECAAELRHGGELAAGATGGLDRYRRQDDIEERNDEQREAGARDDEPGIRVAAKIVGSATLTIVMSTMSMRTAPTITIAASQRRGYGTPALAETVSLISLRRATRRLRPTQSARVPPVPTGRRGRFRCETPARRPALDSMPAIVDVVAAFVLNEPDISPGNRIRLR